VEWDDLDLVVTQRKRHRDRVLAAGEREQRLVAVAFLVGGDQIVVALVLDVVETGHAILLSQIAITTASMLITAARRAPASA
jgi:hypothetical protein